MNISCETKPNSVKYALEQQQPKTTVYFCWPNSVLCDFSGTDFFFLYIQRKLLLWVEVISLKAANEMRTSYDSYFM